MRPAAPISASAKRLRSSRVMIEVSFGFSSAPFPIVDPLLAREGLLLSPECELSRSASQGWRLATDEGRPQSSLDAPLADTNSV